MKTYTIEELRLAQAKGCRIQMQLLDESWLTPDEPLQELLSHHLPIRIHPADEWKARRPIPGEFLHESELAKKPEESSCAISHDAANAPNLRDPKGFCKVCGTDWPDVTPETPDPAAFVAEAREMREALRKAEAALSLLLAEVERNSCRHEETYRVGAIWEVCSSCGAKWADDEGGKPEYKKPKFITVAEEALTKLQPFLP